ncbi:podocan-like [Dermacentor variabilis]|uniref:podocan-like n=1 Tax=Dermacentor variabilis TaxID=34621 RepID=UPI003F5C3321
MGRWTPCLVTLALAWLGLTAAYCPDAASLRPCTCDHSGINCMRANSTAQLRRAFGSGNATTREHNELWIQKTPITSFPSNVLGNFKFGEVHLERNANLGSFTLDAFDNFKQLLSVLSVYGNALRTFEFAKLQRFPFLVALNIGGNQLSRIPANAFRNQLLEKLGIMDNPITFIGRGAFSALWRLKELDLSGTRLVTLGPHSVSIQRGHPELRIQLNRAQIRAIHPTAFHYSAPLVLNLSHNNLTTLERSVFEHLVVRMYNNAGQFNVLPLLGLEGNPLTCHGCSYEWLVQYRFNRPMQTILHNFRCPDGSGLSSISAQRISCRPVWNFANIG